MKKTLSALIAASVALTGLTATPAFARHHDYDYEYDEGNYRGNDDGYYRRVDDRRYDNRGYDNRGYDNRNYDNRGYDNRNYDRGYNDNGRYNGTCRKGKGTVGTIIGAVAGGLLGREIGRGGYNNRPSTTGAIIGAGAGALAGRAIDRSSCR